MIQLRPATVDDLPAIHAVWWAADPAEDSHDNPWFRHVLKTGTMLVAMADSDVVGFAGVRKVGVTLVVSDCFVRPEYQGRGIGAGLLDQLIAQARPVMTLASSDPKAHLLYSRFGMARQWECHYVEGDPRQLRVGQLRVGQPERVGPKPVEVGRYPISESDLVHLRDDLNCKFLEVESAAVAVSADAIESSRARTGAVGQLLAVLGWMADRGDESATLHLGEQHTIFPFLVGAGFQIIATDTLMASEGAEVPDPALLTFNGDILRIDR